jgi:hypothetical protein
MLYAALIASLVLLESRYVFQGLLSQPFFTALILAVAGFDPQFVFLSAAVVHLIYINRKPSGASLFAEYPFAYFVVAVSNGDRTVTTAVFVVSLLLIIAFAKITALFVKSARHFLEDRRYLLMFKNSYPDMPKAFLISFSILLTYSFLMIFTAQYVMDLLLIYDAGSNISIGYEKIGIALCLIFTLKYAFSNLRRKYA